MKTTSVQTIAIEYRLSELPTAFHKAGLAGLLLLINSLRARGKSIVPSEVYGIDSDKVTIAFTESLCSMLMNDLYNAKTIEIKSKSKWQGATIKREEMQEETKDGKTTKSKVFIYDSVQPAGEFFVAHFPDGDGLWLKLWRDMLWNIPRSRPTTRIPYNECAEKGECKEGPAAWKSLVKFKKEQAQGKQTIEEVSSALLLGAQAVNAENVPFVGSVDQNLLLHFWPLSVLTFVPMSIDSDGDSEFSGFALAIPEVSDIESFLSDYVRTLENLNQGLNPNQLAIGYRPRRAVIDLPAESAMLFMASLSQLVSESTERSDFSCSIRSAEYFHLVKLGNNVKTMANGRIAFDRELLDEYRNITQPKGKVRYTNPLFRRNLIAALLSSRARGPYWFRAFEKDLQNFDTKVLLRRSDTPAKAIDDAANASARSTFSADVSKKLTHVFELHSKFLERVKSMGEPASPNTPPPVILNRIVRNYLQAKAQPKSGVKLDKYSNENGDIQWDSIPKDQLDAFNKAKNKLAEGLFLEFRSRRDQAFVDHFAATFFSVTQRLSDADRLELSNMLIVSERRDDLKTLTLLALSANS